MPAKLTDPREMFIHELGDILYAEQLLEKALPKMAREATDRELRAGLQQHLEETREQVGNLKRAFEALGEPAKPERCLGIEGITAEHDRFMREEEPTPELRDVFLTGAGARVEGYEIAAYTSLVAMANALGERRVEELLRENLSQETAALRKLSGLGKRLAKSSTPAAARAGRGGPTVAELRDRARGRGIRGASGMRKAELLRVLDGG